MPSVFVMRRPVAYSLTFEVGPDRSGGAGDTTTVAVWLNGISLGAYRSAPAVALGAPYVWRAHTVALPGFDPAGSEIKFRYSAGADTSHVRRVRVTGSDGSFNFGAYPSGYPYTASEYNGVGPEVQQGEDGGSPAVQYAMNVGTFVATPDDYLHFYFTAASVGSEPPADEGFGLAPFATSSFGGTT